jgi:hypothetical protein
MVDGVLTEAEFREFSERLHAFARGLPPRERLFLTAILARASSRWDAHADQYLSDAEWAISAELAYSIWRSMFDPAESITVNPQPIPQVHERR